MTPTLVLASVGRRKLPEQGHLSAEEEAEYGAVLEEEKRRLMNVEQGNNIVKTYQKFNDDLMQVLNADRNEQWTYLIRKHAIKLRDSFERGTFTGLNEEDLAEVFAMTMGVDPSPDLYRAVTAVIYDTHAGSRIGWEKEAARAGSLVS